MKSFDQLQEESRTVQFNFLMADMATGNTFLDVARTTHDTETRVRNVQNAQLAYDTVARLSKRVRMTEEQGIAFHDKLQAFEQRLRSMKYAPECDGR